jgi:predicted acylesterase/phospholipase RssA
MHQNQTSEYEALPTADYSKADQSCDLVMKGGVTSGVVYPTTMCRLAQKFRFRNIGGTSAGALAAALAAAAEHERRTVEGSSVGFRRLAGVPAYLGSGTHLRDLFQPSPTTAPLFNLGMAWLTKPSLPAITLAALRIYSKLTALAAIGGGIVLAVLLGLVGYISSACNDSDAARRDWIVGVAVVVAVLISLLAFGAFAAWLILRQILATLQGDVPDNDFGLCTGLETPNPGGQISLTPWLADQIDYIAGRTGVETQPADSPLDPLTFGDLHGTPDPSDYPYPTGSEVLDSLNARSVRAVNLEMVTTDVTAGRPYRLPFETTGGTQFFFDPVELARFFPARVLKRMCGGAHSVKIDLANGGSGAVRATATVVPFPDALDLPVIVAARMSMSFPFLFSAVPLYAVDRAAYASWSGVAAEQPEFRKTWFSDGGLSSNIPIHFFDGPIPRWPTFALNLRGFPRTKNGKEDTLDPKMTTESDKVFLATRYDPDVELFDLRGNRRMFQFVNSLLDAMRNWNDNTLMQLPSYRERTVEIAMTDSEGGLNLVMPDVVLKSIMTRGFYAAELFNTTFAAPTLNDSPAWNDHRLIRLRTSLLMQSEWTRRFAMSWKTPMNPPYRDLIDAPGPPYTTVFAPGERKSAHQFADHLADAPSKIDPDVTLTKEPGPSPELRPRPRV